MKYLILVSFLLLSVFSLQAQSSEDEKAIQQAVQTLSDGWNAANGAQFASVFAEEHDFVVWNGYYFKEITVKQNAANHDYIFQTMYKDTKNFTVVDKIRFVREDIAMVHVLAAVVPKNETRPENPEVLFSCLMEKKDGRWKIISFHNLDLEVFQDERMLNSAPIPPQVMYASWYADAKG